MSHLKSEVHRLGVANIEMEQSHKSLLDKLAQSYEERSKLMKILKECNVQAKNFLPSKTDASEENKGLVSLDYRKNYADSEDALDRSTCSNRFSQKFSYEESNRRNNEEWYSRNCTPRGTHDVIIDLEEQNMMANWRSEFSLNTRPRDSVFNTLPILSKDRCNFEEKIVSESHRNKETSSKVEPNVKYLSLMNYIHNCEQKPSDEIEFSQVRKDCNDQIKEGFIESSNNREQKLHCEQPEIFDDCRPRVFFATSAPFATDSTREELVTFDTMDKQLTQRMEEKMLLVEEHTKYVHQSKTGLKFIYYSSFLHYF